MTQYLFFLVFRNIYLKEKIKKHIQSSKELLITVDYLNRNYKYLERKRDSFTNISIYLNKDNVIEFSKSPYRTLVTKVTLSLAPGELENTTQISRYHASIVDNQNLKVLIHNNFVKDKQLLPSNIKYFEGIYHSFNNIFELVQLKRVKLYLSLYDTLVLNPDTISKNLKQIELIGYMDTIQRATLLPNYKYSILLGSQRCDKLFFPTVCLHSIYSLDISSIDLTQPLEVGSLPPRLETLEMNYSSDFSLVENLFPQSLTSLKIGRYNRVLEKEHLPINLKILNMDSYNQPLDPFVLPNSLKKLYMTAFEKQLQANSLPNGIEHISIIMYNGSLIHLPSSIQSLDLYYYNLLTKELDQLCIPNLKKLNLANISIPLDPHRIPKSVEDLSIYINILECNLGSYSAIKTLHLDSTLTNWSKVILPPNLTSLTLGYSITSFDSKLFPKSLISLHIKNKICIIVPLASNENGEGYDKNRYFPSSLKNIYTLNTPKFLVPDPINLYIDSCIQ